MNKGDFVSYIATKNSCTKAEAERVIDKYRTREALIHVWASEEQIR